MAAGLEGRTSLLIDQTRTSIEERHTLRNIGMSPSSYEDSEITKSLSLIKASLGELQLAGNANVGKLISQYNKIVSMYGDDPDVNIAGLEFVSGVSVHENRRQDGSVANNDTTTHNDNTRNGGTKKAKTVRFKEGLIEENEPLGVMAANNNSVSNGKPTGLRKVDQFVQPYRDDPDYDDNSDGDTDGDYRTSSEIFHQQRSLIRDQDDRLGSLAQSVSRQHELSIQIDQELDSHLELLDDVDGLVDHSHSRLEDAKRRLGIFSRKARDNGSILTIVILVLILFVLMIVLN